MTASVSTKVSLNREEISVEPFGNQALMSSISDFPPGLDCTTFVHGVCLVVFHVGRVEVVGAILDE